MRNAECGTNETNAECGMRNAESQGGPRIAARLPTTIPHSEFRIPHLFVGAALFALLAAACQGDGRTPLIVYSPHGRDLLTLLERRFEQLHPDVDVRWLDMGSQEVYDRLRSERANPQADVWFGGPATIFARGARDSLLERSEEHTSELQSLAYLVCRLLLEKKKK